MRATGKEYGRDEEHSVRAFETVRTVDYGGTDKHDKRKEKKHEQNCNF